MTVKILGSTSKQSLINDTAVSKDSTYSSEKIDEITGDLGTDKANKRTRTLQDATTETIDFPALFASMDGTTAKSLLMLAILNANGGISFSTQDVQDFITKSGGTMIGSLTLSGDPTTDNMAANKKYVDDALAEFEKSALKFEGFVSNVAPTGEIQEGTLWYKPSTATWREEPFPWNVYTYTAGAWSATTTEYNWTSMDNWTDLDAIESSGGSTMQIDSTPTAGSNNLVSSGGVYAAFEKNKIIKYIPEPIHDGDTPYDWYFDGVFGLRFTPNSNTARVDLICNDTTNHLVSMSREQAWGGNNTEAANNSVQMNSTTSMLLDDNFAYSQQINTFKGEFCDWNTGKTARITIYSYNDTTMGYGNTNGTFLNITIQLFGE